MKTGDKITVYQDPITCLKSEEVGTVVKVLRKMEGERDTSGRDLYRVKVRFPDGVFERIVSG